MFTSPTTDRVDHKIDLEHQLFAHRQRQQHFRMTEEAMQNAGIRKGDFLLVEPGQPYKLGDVVLALLDNSYYVRFIRRDVSRRPYLDAAHPRRKPLYPRQELRIIGPVTSVVRLLQ